MIPYDDKRRWFHVALLIGCLLASSRLGISAESQLTSPAELISRQYQMMTTTVEIKVATSLESKRAAEKAIERAKDEMQAFVDIVNAWDPRSDVSRVNARAGLGAVKIDGRLMRLLLHAREVSDLSGGAFDVTFVPLGMAWNLRSPQFVVPSEEKIAEAKSLVNYKYLDLDTTAGTALLRRAGMKIELGAIAKGAAVEVAARSLKANGFDNALIRASGDMRAMGHKGREPWVIGIQDPRAPRGSILGKVALRDKAITTSGDYEQMVVVDGKRYCHIIDPRTGRPADKSICVTVIAPDAETADALSTTLFILGPEEGIKLCRRLSGVEALFVDPERRITRTSGFPQFMGRKEQP